MQRPSIGEYAPAYQKYIDLVPDGEYLDLLTQNLTETVLRFDRVPPGKLDYRYADGKWTIKEVLLHIIDTERVFSYRALTAARADTSPHYRMNEELYARNAGVSHRTQQSLLLEFNAVRASTQQLFENLTDAQSRLACNIVPHPMTVQAIGYFVIGHVQHHLAVIEERYF
jgi:hypothetical protein